MILVTKISLHNFWLFIPYIFIRYKVFVREDDRGLFEEFSLQDLKSSHYVLLHNNYVIGTARITYNQDKAQIGRLSIIPKYRNQGYGKIFMQNLVDLIIEQTKVSHISLFLLEGKLRSFYSQFGFKEDGLIYFKQIPFVVMSKSIN